MTRNYSRRLLLPALSLVSWGALAAHIERGTLILDNIPDTPAALADTLDGYLTSRQALPLGWSPQGVLLIATRFGVVDQLHVVEMPRGYRRQITFQRESIDVAAFSPDPSRTALVYAQDTAGRDNPQLYYQRVDPTGVGTAVAPLLLTDGKSRNTAPVWSNAGHAIAFATNARNGVSHDIDIVEPDGGALPRLVVTGDEADWVPLDWSPDDRRLLVRKTVSIAEAYLYVIDLDTGQKREIAAGAAKAGIGDAKFSRDGTGVYLLSNRDGEYADVRYVNQFTGEKTLLSPRTSGDVEQLAVSRDGHYLAYVANEGGYGQLNLLDLKAHVDLTPPRLPSPGLIDHLSFDPEGKRLLFGYSAANRPQDAYVLDVATNHLEAWTQSEMGKADPATFVTPRRVQFPTFDREEGHLREIPAYVYEPKAPGPHPVLLWFHDGPESQFRPGFDPWLQFVVGQLGFAVVAPDVRGSSGHGKSYEALDNGTSRDDVIKDLGALIIWVDAQSTFDAKHVVVAGEGYGGFLALAALANYGDRLRGGVDYAGMSDFISFLTNTAPYGQNRRRAEYGDERDPDMRAYLRRISPLTTADRITRPLLVVQGRNDAQVPLSESDQIVNRLRSRGGQVEYLEATDEGHDFRRLENREAYMEAFAVFLKSLE